MEIDTNSPYDPYPTDQLLQTALNSSKNLISPTKHIIYKRIEQPPMNNLDESFEVNNEKVLNVLSKEELVASHTCLESLQYLNSHFSQPDNDWLGQIDFVNSFRYILFTEPDFIVSSLQRYIPNLRHYLNSLRSVVAKTAMISFLEMFDILKNSSLVDFISTLRLLFMKACGDKNFINEAGQDTLTMMATKCDTPDLYTYLLPFLKDRNPKIQALSTKTLYTYLSTYPSLLSVVDLSSLYKLFPILLTSKSPECRTVTKDFISWFIQIKTQEVFLNELITVGVNQYDRNTIVGKVNETTVKKSERRSLRDFIKNKKKMSSLNASPQKTISSQENNVQIESSSISSPIDTLDNNNNSINTTVDPNVKLNTSKDSNSIIIQEPNISSLIMPPLNNDIIMNNNNIIDSQQTSNSSEDIKNNQSSLIESIPVTTVSNSNSSMISNDNHDIQNLNNNQQLAFTNDTSSTTTIDHSDPNTDLDLSSTQ
ncbi:hypothetical protein WA158_001036 [Blastocystis sp. Blastoise]